MHRVFILGVAMLGWTGTAAAADALGKCPSPMPYTPETPVKWTALSSNARAVTGAIEFSKGAIRFENGTTAKLKYVGERQLLSYMGLGQTPCASFYTFEPAFAGELLGENTLCGAPDTPAVTLAISAPMVNETALYVFRSGDDVEGLPGKRVSFCGSFYFRRAE
jgi:hypothetical protein